MGSIQPLVHSIRSRANVPTLTAVETDHINSISRSVQDTVFRTQEACESAGDAALAKHAPPVIAVLRDCRENLLGVVESDGRGGARERVPPLAFKTARAMKELVLRVERIENGEISVSTYLPNEI